jgi:UDP-glucose 4-epimerase
MKVLVTGGAGFIGSHIHNKLLELGHSVTVLDDLSTGKENYLNPQAHFVKADILDRDALVKVFKDISPEVVYHLAAQISVPWSMEHPFEDMQKNIVGTMNVMEAMKESGAKKIVYSNTGGAYYGEVGDENMPIKEETPITRPTSFYGVSKGSAETYIKLYGNIYGINWVSLRYSNVYGPRQDGSKETGITAIFVKKMMAGEQPTINGDGTHARDYVFIDDVVAANIKALDYPQNDYFNIASSNEISNNEVFDVIEQNLKTGMQKVYGPERVGDPYRISLSFDKAKEKLRWEPQVSFEEGIKRTVEYYKAQG